MGREQRRRLVDRSIRNANWEPKKWGKKTHYHTWVRKRGALETGHLDFEMCTRCGHLSRWGPFPEGRPTEAKPKGWEG